VISGLLVPGIQTHGAERRADAEMLRRVRRRRDGYRDGDLVVATLGNRTLDARAQVNRGTWVLGRVHKAQHHLRAAEDAADDVGEQDNEVVVEAGVRDPQHAVDEENDAHGEGQRRRRLGAEDFPMVVSGAMHSPRPGTLVSQPVMVAISLSDWPVTPVSASTT